jgi:transcriptional regulator with XRE-family HTH domain
LKRSGNDDERQYGRGTGVPDPIDVYVGARVRARRLLIGMNQETLARELGLTFQQVQKYEGGTNRISASRLSQIADVLGVSIDYFYQGLEPDGAMPSPPEQQAQERMQRPETIELIRSYYAIPDPEARERFLQMVKTVAQSQRPR